MQAWKDFLKSQEKKLGKETVKKWLSPLKVIHFDACNIHLEAKDSFQANWFEEHIRPLARTQLINNNGRLIRCHLTIQAKVLKEKKSKDKLNETPNEKFLSDHLEPHSHLAQFVPGEKNLLTYRVFSQLTGYLVDSNVFKEPELPLGTYNPIFLFGPKGVGKTHLLMATTIALRNRGLSVLYSKAETFTEHVIRAFRSGQIGTFRATYRNLDVLILDDVHLLARKKATQEELFHTFNTLHTEGKQIIVSSNCSPRQLEDIEERLVSRFEWGLSLTLEKLSKSELKEVVLKRAEMLQFPLREEVIDYLITTFSSHKALTQSIEALVLRTHINSKKKKKLSKDLDIPTVKSLLKDLITKEFKTIVTPERIIKLVADFYGIKVDDILSKSQSKEFVLPRQISMYLCRAELNTPYLQLGRLFSRDHSTVISSVKLVHGNLENKNKDVLHSLTNLSQQVANI